MCVGITTEKRQTWENKSIFLPFLGHEETSTKATIKFFMEEKNFQKLPKIREGSYHVTVVNNHKKMLLLRILRRNLWIQIREVTLYLQFCQLCLSALCSSLLLPAMKLKEKMYMLTDLPHQFLIKKKKKYCQCLTSPDKSIAYRLSRGDQIVVIRTHMNTKLLDSMNLTLFYTNICLCC